MDKLPLTWADITRFKVSEFADPSKPDSGYMMDLAFVHKLEKLREAVKFPLIIHSGYRTAEHNARVGGVEGSAHMTGHAADIRVRSSSERFTILEAALRMGFTRIGIGRGFIHIDDSLTHPQRVVWIYPASRG